MSNVVDVIFTVITAILIYPVLLKGLHWVFNLYYRLKE